MHTTTTEFEFAVFDSKGYDPESVSPTNAMAEQYAKDNAVGTYEIRSRIVSEWEPTRLPV